MAGMDWFRWHHGSVTDPKFQLVAKQARCSVAEVLGVWATLLEEASQNDDRGCFGTLDFEALDCALGLIDGKAYQIFTLMADRYLLDTNTKRITSWSRRQPLREREDDKSVERMRALRERQKNSMPSDASKNHVTPCDAKKSLEEIRGDKRREEGEGERAREPQTQSQPPQISSEYLEVIKTERPELDAAMVFSNFCDHYPPEKQTVSRWKKWIASEFAPSESRSPPSTADPDSKASVEALGMSLGMGKWDELSEPWQQYKTRVRGVTA